MARRRDKRGSLKYLGEARELLSHDEAYVEGVIDAWLGEETVRIGDMEFVPKRSGVEVYVDGDYEATWRGEAIELAFQIKEAREEE
jgi:hypothetical protein